MLNDMLHVVSVKRFQTFWHKRKSVVTTTSFFITHFWMGREKNCIWKSFKITTKWLLLCQKASIFLLQKAFSSLKEHSVVFVKIISHLIFAKNSWNQHIYIILHYAVFTNFFLWQNQNFHIVKKVCLWNWKQWILLKWVSDAARLLSSWRWNKKYEPTCDRKRFLETKFEYITFF